MSSLPNFARAAETKCVQSCSRVKSAITKPAAPDLLISAATAASSDSERAHKNTDAPSCAKRRAMARPIPRLDPVTNATLSFSNMKGLPAMWMREDRCSPRTTQALWVLDATWANLSIMDRMSAAAKYTHPNDSVENKTGGPCIGHP